jgi:hypothetical protein
MRGSTSPVYPRGILRFAQNDKAVVAKEWWFLKEDGPPKTRAKRDSDRIK